MALQTTPRFSVLILGCGYTGKRVARSLLARGVSITATTRHPERLRSLARSGVEVIKMDVLDPDSLAPIRKLTPREPLHVVHSIPIVSRADEPPFDPTPLLCEALGPRPARLVYLSTTGVYGDALDVDETTEAKPRNRSGELRIHAEQTVRSGPWPSLVLRPAAIYGPGRGVHESMRKGTFRLVGHGGNFVSRIQVDDLAAITAAAIDSPLTGTFPVADAEPCTSLEMAELCAKLLGTALPPSVPAEGVHHTRLANRRVNGNAILDRLGVTLRYPSYRTGVPAALAASSPSAPVGQTLE
jgi:nucleoside-diphosphate-sugar epimerase